MSAAPKLDATHAHCDSCGELFAHEALRRYELSQEPALVLCAPCLHDALDYEDALRDARESDACSDCGGRGCSACLGVRGWL